MKKAGFAIAGILVAASPVLANDFEDLDALEMRVAATASGAIVPIDRRLKLGRCPVPASVDAPALQAIAVRCTPLGWRIRVALVAKPDDLPNRKRRIIVRRGDPVDITYLGYGFELIGQGVAMNDASEGDAVRVKSLTSPKESVGMASGPASVQISP